MEALKNYLFENSDDLPERHCINLLKILIISYEAELKKKDSQQVQVPIPIPVQAPAPVPFVTSERIIRITEDRWNTQLKDLVDGFNYNNPDINLIPAKLKSIPPGPWVPTRFVFPSSLTIEQRQKLHISRSRSVYDCDSYTMQGCLNYLIY